MSVRLTDGQIEAYLQESKRSTVDLSKMPKLKSGRGHHRLDIELTGDSGTRFVIKLRHGAYHTFDFSAILCVQLENPQTLFRLRRYNGKGHRHTNHLEGNSFFGFFHIHTATERYQRACRDEDDYAEKTDRFSTLAEALQCLVRDSNVVLPDDVEGTLF